MQSRDDYLIFRPRDVDLSRSPLRRSLDAPTHLLGAFNPGLARLPSGHLLLMVRVAEALSEPVVGEHRAVAAQEQRSELAVPAQGDATLHVALHREPDVAAFRKHVQEQYLASDLAKDWPAGMVDKINAL